MSSNWNGILDYCCQLDLNGTVIAEGCLRLQPNWMEEIQPDIGHMTLKSLAIPGTHQSGAFSRSVDHLDRFKYCQEEDVLTQLLYGIRALDLRPGAFWNR